MKTKIMHYNYSSLGIVSKDTEEELFSMTPIDFYNSFDALAKHFNENMNYNRPKLYRTTHDHTTNVNQVKIKETWGNKYKLLLYAPDCGHNYGEYTDEELKTIFNAMKEYVLNASTDPVFLKRSDDVSNIGYNPYTIYKELYGNDTYMTCELILTLMAMGEWHYMSRTLKENILHVRNNFDFENKVDNLKSTNVYNIVINNTKNLTTREKFDCFNLLNNYTKM